MFDAVNAVLDGPYRPFRVEAVAPGASPEAAAIRAAYRRPERVPDEKLIKRPTTRRSPASPRALKRSPVASSSARPQPMRCSRRALEITATIRSSRATRQRSRCVDPDSTRVANPQTPFLQFVTPFGYDDPARFRPQAPRAR